MSKIEWITWNPIVGCSAISPGCANCYAMRMAAALQKINRTGGSNSAYVNRYDGTTQPSEAGPVWTGKVALAPEHILTAPLRWKRPRRIFVNSMGDLFHESVPDAWIDRVFAMMALMPQHTFQCLTKRSKRMRDYFSGRRADGFGTVGSIIHKSHSLGVSAATSDGPWGAISLDRPSHKWSLKWPLPNVWLGISAEDQERAAARIPDLLATPAALRFVSAEPLLGPIDFTQIDDGAAHREVPRDEWGCLDNDDSPPALWWNVLTGERSIMHGGGTGDWSRIDGRLDWIIVGGESGPDARDNNFIENARSLFAQCRAAGVPFFGKQNVGKKPLPSDLDVKEFPHA